jgi:hypothetical protein
MSQAISIASFEIELFSARIHVGYNYRENERTRGNQETFYLTINASEHEVSIVSKTVISRL